jgi:hypothetical protein
MSEEIAPIGPVTSGGVFTVLVRRCPCFEVAPPSGEEAGRVGRFSGVAECNLGAVRRDAGVTPRAKSNSLSLRAL